MKKLLVVIVLAAAAYAVYAFVIRPPEKRACARMAELCGLGEQGARQCTEVLDSLKKSHPESVPKVATCVADAKSCAEAMGCASGAALSIGAGFLKGFVDGLQKASQ
jgi:hypothetical protein